MRVLAVGCKLTRKQCTDQAAPESGAVTLWDTEIKGFGVRIYAATSRGSSRRSFFLNYRVDGVERRITIGDFPTWSVEAARLRAKELRKEIAGGHNPAVQKRERREAPTVADLAARYEAEVIPSKRLPGKNGRLNDERRMLALMADHLGRHTKVADIHAGDIKAAHQAITRDRGPVRANRVLAIASKAFSLSLVPLAGENTPWRNAVQGNPCKGVVRNHEEQSGRLYSPAELAAISDGLAEYEGQVSADCIRLMMLTGCRPGEAMAATWSEFDEPGYWVKPSAHTKQKKDHRVPLAAPALELIDRLRGQRDNGVRCVFPGERHDVPLRTVGHCWRFVRKRAGLPADARLYDLRHSFASTGAGSGLSLPIIGRLLGHTQPRTTQRYAAHLADDPLKAAVDKIGAVITGAGKAGADVVSIKR
jgi:integrase